MDDEPAVLQSLGRLLKTAGFNVETCSSGLAAFALAREAAFDVILLDLKLPDISGLEVLQHLRHAGVATPVVLLTGFPSSQSGFNAGRLGAFGYLEKPAPFTNIVSALTEAAWISGGRLQSQRLFSSRPVLDSPCLIQLQNSLRTLQKSKLSSNSEESQATGRQELARLLAHVAADRTATFSEYVVAAKSLRMVLSVRPITPLSTAVLTIASWIQEAGRRDSIAMDSTAQRVLARLEAIGRHWSKLSEEELTHQLELRRTIVNQALAEEVGLTFHQCRRAIVMRNAALELVGSDEHVRQVAFRVGYQDPGNFDRDFTAFFGTSPTGFRRLQDAAPAA